MEQNDMPDIGHPYSSSFKPAIDSFETNELQCNSARKAITKKAREAMGRILRQWRLSNGYTRVELARRIQTDGTTAPISRQSLTAYEHGDAMIPLDSALSIARITGVPVRQALKMWLSHNLGEWNQKEIAFINAVDDETTVQNAFEQDLLDVNRRIVQLGFDQHPQSYGTRMRRLIEQIGSIGTDSLEAWEQKLATPLERRKEKNKTLPLLEGCKIASLHLSPDKKLIRSLIGCKNSSVRMQYLLPTSAQEAWQEMLSYPQIADQENFNARFLPLPELFEHMRKFELLAGFCLYNIKTQQNNGQDLDECIGIEPTVQPHLRKLMTMRTTDKLHAFFDETWNRLSTTNN